MARAKKVVEFVNVIRNALQARQDACVRLGKLNQAGQLNTPIREMTDGVLKAAQSTLTQTDFAQLCEAIAYCDESGKGKEQVKSVVKIVTMLRALACNDGKLLDGNTRCGILTLLNNDGHASVREMVFSQSKSARAAGDLFAVRESFKSENARYSIGTGNSQVSQVRQVLNVFGFFEGFIKGGRGNDPQLNEYGFAVLHNLVFVQKSEEQ